MTTAEIAAQQLYRLDRELAKIIEELSLNDTNTVIAVATSRGKAPRPSSALAPAALRTTHEIVERLLRECQVAAGQGCHVLPPREGPLRRRTS